MFVHRKYISKLQPTRFKFLDLFISTDALHVSGGSSAHRQEHITVNTTSVIVNQHCCLLQQAAVLVDSMYSCMYSYVLLMMGGGTA